MEKPNLKFDVNVVPDADYTRDYEELYQDFNTKNWHCQGDGGRKIIGVRIM